MEKFVGLLTIALENTRKLIAGFDPIKGHRAENFGTGSSVFHKSIKTAEDLLLDEVAKADLVAIEPGWGGAVAFIFKTNNESKIVGEAAFSVPVDADGVFKIRMEHGCLQAFGEIRYTYVSTDLFTIVLTPEDVDGERVFAFASAFPGRPDPAPNREGLVDGGTITGADVVARKLRPKADKV